MGRARKDVPNVCSFKTGKEWRSGEFVWKDGAFWILDRNARTKYGPFESVFHAKVDGYLVKLDGGKKAGLTPASKVIEDASTVA